MSRYTKDCHNQNNDLNNWLTTKQLADYLGRTPNAIRILVQRGKLNVHARLGRIIYFDKNKIDEQLKSAGDQHDYKSI